MLSEEMIVREETGEFEDLCTVCRKAALLTDEEEQDTYGDDMDWLSSYITHTKHDPYK